MLHNCGDSAPKLNDNGANPCADPWHVQICGRNLRVFNVGKYTLDLNATSNATGQPSCFSGSLPETGTHSFECEFLALTDFICLEVQMAYSSDWKIRHGIIGRIPMPHILLFIDILLPCFWMQVTNPSQNADDKPRPEMFMQTLPKWVFQAVWGHSWGGSIITQIRELRGYSHLLTSAALSIQFQIQHSECAWL